MRTLAERRQVNKWIARGASDYAIADITGIPRSTVQRWRTHPLAGPRSSGRRGPWRPPDPTAYAYLLGLYLGDGCLGPRGSPLMIALDARYPGIVESAESAIKATVPDIAPRRYRPKDNLVRVIASSPTWRDAFPQHGRGRKHLRAIELEPWQREIATAFPRELLRGLIHSDGCRTTNGFKTKLPSGRVAPYEYPRYFFSNLSEDIRRIFCEHCELLGIRWTQSNPRNISISHRKSVALMDGFIGPKW
jgi:Homeodomain-like domain